MIVCKFGGTSVSTASRIKTICQIAQNTKNPIIVVSALSGVTDLLLNLVTVPKEKAKTLQQIKSVHDNLSEKIFKNGQSAQVKSYVDTKLEELGKLVTKKKYSKAQIDKIISFGEIISSFIIAKALESNGVKSQQVIASNLIVTDNNFGSADFVPQLTKNKTSLVILPLVKKKIVPVITGFVGATPKGQITTLGRGGSDYSAAIIGYSLNAKEVQIWTDVDGILTSDPRVVKKAHVIAQISYKEASELAAFGAKVLHPRTIKPAIKAGIPVRVLNTLNPKKSGTLVCKQPSFFHPITAVSYKKRITLVNIYSTEMLFAKGFLARIFNIFSKHNISVDLVSVSEVSVSLTVESDHNLPLVEKEVSTFASIYITHGLGMVSLIGEGVTKSSSTIRRVFEILDKHKILVKMVSLGATDINLSLVVQYDHVEQAVKLLHNKLLVKEMNHL